MIQVLLLTRGDLSDAWLRATEATCGCPPTGFATLSLPWNGSCDEDSAHVRTQVRALLHHGPVLVLTDLPGGTPANLACQQTALGRVAVVTGANLPMVLRLACEDREGRSLDDLADWICDKGRAAIRRVEPRAVEPAE
jgi:mannose PTS system EIIA component